MFVTTVRLPKGLFLDHQGALRSFVHIKMSCICLIECVFRGPWILFMSAVGRFPIIVLISAYNDNK